MGSWKKGFSQIPESAILINIWLFMQRIAAILAVLAIVAEIGGFGSQALAKEETHASEYPILQTVEGSENRTLALEFPVEKMPTKKPNIQPEDTMVPEKIEVIKEPEIIDTTGFDNTYRAAGEAYGISWEIISAVHLVETGRSGDTYVSSYAGAQGPMQFLPSTFYTYGVDGDGDGVANINDVDDAIFSAANYLAACGGTYNISQGLYGYNHSSYYVNNVIAIAQSIGYQG